MKFKVDESLPMEVAEFLRTHGHDAHTIPEEKIVGSEDQTVFATCQHEKRIIVTLNLDFAAIRRYPPGDSSGIIVLRLAHQRKDYVLAFIPRLLPLLESERLTGSLCIIRRER